MNTFDTLVQHGCEYHTEGNNAVVLRLERELLERAGYDPLEFCPALKSHPRIALKLLKSPIPGTAAKEAELQRIGHDLLESKEPPRSFFPEVLSEETSASGLDERLRRRVSGIMATNAHMEYILMEWVEGTDFITLIYQHVLANAIRDSLNELHSHPIGACKKAGD